MKDFHGETVIFRDTEYTSWEGAQARNWSGPNEFREIIQIGATMVNTTTREEIKSFSVFVKPVKNPLLSEFIINLTKITQEDIDTQGKDFTTALKEFISRAGDRDTIDFYSYGRDEIILSENCGMHHMTMPFRRGRCKNVVDIFLANDVPANNYNSGSINQYFNIPNNDTEHNALADARNIARSLKLMYSKIK